MIQTFLQLPVVTLVRVVLGMVLAFGILPALVLARPRGALTSLDAAVSRSVRWIGVVLVGSHLLVLVRLFHVLPILLLCGWAMLVRQGKASVPSRRHRRVSAAAQPVVDDGIPPPPSQGDLPPPPGALVPPPPAGVTVAAPPVARQAVDHGFDEMDTRAVSAPQRLWLMFTDVMHVVERAGPQVVVTWIANGWRKVRAWLARLFSVTTLKVFALMAPVLGILAVSLALRVDFAFRFETLSPPEAYVFLNWAKAFAANQLYVDGIYPYGLPAFIAFIAKMTPGIDLYEIVRYTGGLIGVLLVFGIFYAALRLTANIAAALFAAGAFGLFGTIAEWHAPWTRQIGPLPQELGFAIALLALPSAILAVTDRRRDHVPTVLWAAIGIGLIHPVPLVIFIVMASVGAVAASVVSRGGRRGAIDVIGAGLAGGALAHVYVPVALLVGQSVFRGMDQPFTPVQLGTSTTQVLSDFYGTTIVGHNLLTAIAGVGSALALLVAWILSRRERTHHIGVQLAGTAAVGLVVVALYDVRLLNLPHTIAGPAGSLLGIAVALALAAGVAAVTAPLFTVRRAMVRSGLAIVVAAVALAGFSQTFELRERTRAPSEYDAMAAVTRGIMRNQDAFSYSVVGTPQQRQAVAGVGSFIELWVFARDVTVRDAQDPGFVVPDLSSLMFARDLGEALPIPTADIYVFVEKVPFPVPEQPPVGPTEEYYYDREKRGRIMATVYAWAEYYRYYHTDMEIHYEDDEIVVYRIARRPNPVAAAASPQFKDYTWEPGVLFTGGPTSPQEVDIPWR